MKQISIFDHGVPESTSNRLMTTKRYLLYVDGASRGNPGPSGIGIAVKQDGEFVLKQGYAVGTKTNNQAEYLALITGLLLVIDHSKAGDTVLVRSDSLLMINQLNRLYKIKNEELKVLYTIAVMLGNQLNAVFQHVLREKNMVADQMANYGIDQQIPLPDAIYSFLEMRHVQI